MPHTFNLPKPEDRTPDAPTDDRMQIVKSFARAVATLDLDALYELLHDDGEFEIVTNPGRDEPVHSEEVGKMEFLDYLLARYMEFSAAHPDRGELQYVFDQCLHCDLGAPVVLFEGGRFPVRTSLPFEAHKLGLRLGLLDGRVNAIVFCARFLHSCEVEPSRPARLREASMRLRERR